MDLPRGIFGKAVKKARLDKNLTQEKLAELIGITPMHMKQLESERRNPSVEVLYRLVYALDLSLDSLFSHTHDDETRELLNKINLALNRCTNHELSIVYATIEAILNKTPP
jgi:transcriptional regulator with XRE-family HTH domain